MTPTTKAMLQYVLMQLSAEVLQPLEQPVEDLVVLVQMPLVNGQLMLP